MQSDRVEMRAGARSAFDVVARFFDAPLALRIACATVAPCVVALWRYRPGTTGRDVALGVGVALVCCATAAVVTMCLTAVLEAPLCRAAARSTEAPPPPRAIARVDRARWAEAVYDALLAVCARDASLFEPEIATVVAGERGVELLLHAPCCVAPTIFDVCAGGVLWVLHPSVEFDDLIGPEATAPESEPRLTLIGSDEESDFFTVELDVPKYRLTEVDGGAPCYESVHPIGEDDNRAPRSFGAPLVLIEDASTVLVEPLGLLLDRVGEEALPTTPPSVGTMVEEPAPAAVVSSQLTDSSSDEETEHRPTPDEFVPRGPVEVRILREQPDLVGALHEIPSPGAVEFVAYLAMHNYRATSARLRESLGTARARESKSDRMTWNSAASARRSLGTEYIPVARGHQIYRLSDSVTCDWTRFRALCEIAEENGADPLTRRGALCAALSLVEGVPGLSSRRFSWLDVDGTLDQIAAAVLHATRELAHLGQASASPELVSWAIAKGRLFAPSDSELLDLKATTFSNDATG
jgi:hypothetical protein